MALSEPLPIAAVKASTSEPVRQVVAHRSREVSAGEELEGFVLRSFVETMLPKADTAFFGKGTAAEVWRSKLAEHIGAELARGGGIGLADALDLPAEGGPRDAGAGAPAGDDQRKGDTRR